VQSLAIVPDDETLGESPPPDAPPEMAECLKVLEHVLKAAELYLHSGLAGAEHARLEKVILVARKSKAIRARP